MFHLSIFFYLLTTCFQANAGFLIDPHGGIKIAGVAELASREFSIQQFDIGLKSGWQSGSTQAGLDLNLLFPTYESKYTPVRIESYSGFQYGLFIARRFDWFRVWGTWVIASSQTSGIDSSKIKGTGFEFGSSFGPQNFVNVFLKLQILQYRKRLETDGTEVDLSDGQEIETKLLIFGFDIPFHFSKE